LIEQIKEENKNNKKYSSDLKHMRKKSYKTLLGYTSHFLIVFSILILADILFEHIIDKLTNKFIFQF
jgi:hypothetical protein